MFTNLSSFSTAKLRNASGYNFKGRLNICKEMAMWRKEFLNRQQ